MPCTVAYIAIYDKSSIVQVMIIITIGIMKWYVWGLYIIVTNVTIVLERVGIANYIRCNVSMILFEISVTFPYYPSNLSSTLSTAARISSSKINESNTASKHHNIMYGDNKI